MRVFNVNITEIDGSKWTLPVLATGTVDACIRALDAIGRVAKFESKGAAA